MVHHGPSPHLHELEKIGIHEKEGGGETRRGWWGVRAKRRKTRKVKGGLSRVLENHNGHYRDFGFVDGWRPDLYVTYIKLNL